jgi:hypothetical protein
METNVVRKTPHTAAVRADRTAGASLTLMKRLRRQLRLLVPCTTNNQLASPTPLQEPVQDDYPLRQFTFIARQVGDECCQEHVRSSAIEGNIYSKSPRRESVPYIAAITGKDKDGVLEVSQPLTDKPPGKHFPISPGFKRGDPTGYLELGSRQWFWEGLNRVGARAKLSGKPDGTFLVRPTSDRCHYYAASVVRSGKVHHLLIKHNRGWWSFYDSMVPCKASAVELIESAMEESKSGTPLSSVIGPVLLVHPLLRPVGVRSLQDQCVLVVQMFTARNMMSELPLPNRIKENLMRR